MTVLNVIELTETAPWVDIAFGVSFILFLSLLISGAVMAGSFKRTIEKIGNAFIALGIIFFIVAIAMAGCMNKVTVPTGEFQYEVMIDDNVTFMEVIEKYTIIEQRGEIFVLEEKE